MDMAVVIFVAYVVSGEMKEVQMRSNPLYILKYSYENPSKDT